VGLLSRVASYCVFLRLFTGDPFGVGTYLIGPTWGPYVNLKASKVVDGPQTLLCRPIFLRFQRSL